jgi:hypothetical protein
LERSEFFKEYLRELNGSALEKKDTYDIVVYSDASVLGYGGGGRGGQGVYMWFIRECKYDFVKKWVVFSHYLGKYCIVPGKGYYGMFGKFLPFNMIAVRVAFPA